MTPAQISIIQQSWQTVTPIADTTVDLFYSRLFFLNPQLRALFPAELADQKRKMVSMLSRLVTALSDVQSIIPSVQALGRRHALYGVTTRDYDTVAAALLWSLEQGLGKAWNDAVKESWIAAYALLSNVMLAATKPAA